jgi:hypothetical protein
MPTVYENLVQKAVAKGIAPDVAAAAAEAKLAKEGRSLMEMAPEAAPAAAPVRSALVQKAVAKGIAPDVAAAAAEQKIERAAQKAFAAAPDFSTGMQRAATVEMAEPGARDVVAEVLGPRRTAAPQDLLMEQMPSSRSAPKAAPAVARPSTTAIPEVLFGPSSRAVAAAQRFAEENVDITGVPKVSYQEIARMPALRPYESLLPEEKAAVLLARRRADIAKTEADVESTSNRAALAAGLFSLPAVGAGGGIAQFAEQAVKGTMQTAASAGLAKRASSTLRGGLLRPEQEARLATRPDEARALSAMDPLSTVAAMGEEEESVRRYGLPEVTVEGTLEEKARTRLMGSPMLDASVRPEADAVRRLNEISAKANPLQYVPVGPPGDEYLQVATSPLDALLVNPTAFDAWAQKYPEPARKTRELEAQQRAAAKTVTIPGVFSDLKGALAGTPKPLTREDIVRAARAPEVGLQGAPAFLREALAAAPEQRATLYVENPEQFRKTVTQESIRKGLLPSAEFLGLTPDQYIAVARYGRAQMDPQGNVYLDPTLAASIADLIATRDETPEVFDTVIVDLVQGSMQAP